MTQRRYTRPSGHSLRRYCTPHRPAPEPPRAPQKPRVLRLTLSRAPFEVMQTGEKPREFRRPSDWIISRLVDRNTGRPKAYDVVEFTNGYGPACPRFTAPYLGYKISPIDTTLTYSNGLVVEVKAGDYIIFLGEPAP